MSTVLAYTSPAAGHLFPLTPLLLELRSRGHRIHLRTLQSQVPQMVALGFDARALDPAVEAVALEDYGQRGQGRALAAAARAFAERGLHDGPDLRRAIDEAQPDVVVVDVNSWGAAAAAEAWGGPWVSFSPYTPALRSPGTPPFGPGLPPMGGPAGRLRDAVVQRAVGRVVAHAMLAPVNEVRQGQGVPAVASTEELLRKAPLMLVTTSKPFEYDTTDWGPRVRMVGSFAWEPPVAAPDWVSSVDRPIVLVTTSSEFQDDGILARTALEAFVDEPVHVVVTMPAGVPDDLRVPSNAIVERFLPHSPVLDRAAVAVTHGGMGATQKALSRGIPVCVVPFGRDQHEVARRVEVSGSGTRLSPRRLTPDRLRSAVERAMTMTEGARRVAQGFVDAGGPPAAADAVEELLRRSVAAGPSSDAVEPR